MGWPGPVRDGPAGGLWVGPGPVRDGPPVGGHWRGNNAGTTVFTALYGKPTAPDVKEKITENLLRSFGDLVFMVVGTEQR